MRFYINSRTTNTGYIIKVQGELKNVFRLLIMAIYSNNSKTDLTRTGGAGI